MVYLRNKDLLCVNIYCNQQLSEYELDRQKNGWRYRFCKSCRIKITSGKGKVSWKCLNCQGVMSCSYPVGSYYCSDSCRKSKRAVISIETPACGGV